VTTFRITETITCTNSDKEKKKGETDEIGEEEQAQVEDLRFFS
jgi:hypothetical protein